MRHLTSGKKGLGLEELEGILHFAFQKQPLLRRSSMSFGCYFLSDVMAS